VQLDGVTSHVSQIASHVMAEIKPSILDEDDCDVMLSISSTIESFNSSSKHSGGLNFKLLHYRQVFRSFTQD
jgi:hypothetical protein